MGALSCPVCILSPVLAMSCWVSISTWVCRLHFFKPEHYQCACAAARLSILPAMKKCWIDLLSWAVSPLKVSDLYLFFYFLCISFWRTSLLLLNGKHQSIICQWKKRNQTRSHPFPLSHTSLCLQPLRMSNLILARPLHPSCLYQWLMFYFATFAKKIPFFWWVLLLP